MAFSNENILSGHGPQIPTLSVPQGGSPVVSFTLVDPSSPAAVLDCVARLSLQDGQDYDDFTASGGSVVATAREMWSSDHAIFTGDCTEVDAAKGTFTYKVPLAATDDPGVFVFEAALLASDGSIVLANAGYVEIYQTLLTDNPISVISVPLIRRMLRDATPLANRILEECEFTIQEIQDAIAMAIDEFNSTPPVMTNLNYTTKTFKWPLWLAKGAIGNLLSMAALWYARNDLRVQSAGITSDDMGKAPLYQQLANQYKQEWRDWVKMARRQINISRGWGRVTSRAYP